MVSDTLAMQDSKEMNHALEHEYNPRNGDDDSLMVILALCENKSK